MSSSPEILLPPPSPAAYTTEEELTASLERKGTPWPGSGLYDRDGRIEITDIENALAEITIPDARLNVVVSSGMAGVTGAVHFALAREGKRRGEPVSIAFPPQLYSQSTKYLQTLEHIGASTVNFDSGDPEAVDGLFDRAEPPGVIFAETVANTPNMPVVDVLALIERNRELGEDAPILILDNTLPLSTGLDFNSILTPEDKVLVVESGTKSAMHNSEMLGVVYSKNEELIDEFRKFKATLGIVTSTNASESILDTLNATIPGFHERNRALFASTGKLAVALAKAQRELGTDTDFDINYPTLPSHPNHEYVKNNMPKLYVPKRFSPVTFITSTRWANESPGRDLLRRISGHPRMQEQIREGQVFFGQSFSFEEARLLYDPNTLYVRISGGYGIDDDALAGALYESAVDL